MHLDSLSCKSPCCDVFTPAGGRVAPKQPLPFPMLRQDRHARIRNCDDATCRRSGVAPAVPCSRSTVTCRSAHRNRDCEHLPATRRSILPAGRSPGARRHRPRRRRGPGRAVPVAAAARRASERRGSAGHGAVPVPRVRRAAAPRSRAGRNGARASARSRSGAPKAGSHPAGAMGGALDRLMARRLRAKSRSAADPPRRSPGTGDTAAAPASPA